MVSNHSDNFTELGSVIALLTDYHANGAYEKLKENVTLLDTENYAVMIRTTNFEANEFSKNLIYVDESAYSFLRKSKVYPRDLIMNKIANPGTVYFMPDIGKPVSLGMNLFLIRLDESKVDPYFIYAFLRKNEHYVKSFASGSTTKTITKEDVRRLRVYCPPLAEQKKIAQILSSWDQAIATTERLLDLARQQEKALMQQLLTGKKRFPGFEGAWVTHLLEDLEESGMIELGRGNVISKIDIENLPGDFPIYSSSVKNDGLMGAYGNYMFDEELISWSVDGGGDFFHRRKHKFSITNVSGYMRINTENLNYKFIASQLQLQHSAMSFDYQSKAHPSVIRKLYKLAIPTIEEQVKIAEVLTTADQEIETLQSQLDGLRQEKKALMQALLTGKRRVQIN